MVRSTSQRAPNALAVTTCRNVVGLLKAAERRVSSCCVEICREYNRASERLDRKRTALLVMHVARDSAVMEAKELLWDVSQGKHAIGSILLFDSLDRQLDEDFLHAGADYCFPSNINPLKLAHAMDKLIVQARNGELPAAVGFDRTDELAELDPTFYVSPQMEEMMIKVRHVALKNTTILLSGETGTGKTRLAKLIHELSPRHAEPYRVVSLSDLAPTLLESELFGHVKGSFSYAENDRLGKLAAVGAGTLLLDEINSLPLPLQGKLLRVVDERVFEPVGSDEPQQFQARIIAASNSPLDQVVAKGLFRADLFYRLNVIGFCLPPLREQVSAIAPLAHRFLAEFAAKDHSERTEISSEALGALEMYDWPGNIRELRNVIEQVVAVNPGPVVELEHLPEAIRSKKKELPSLKIGHTPDDPPEFRPDLARDLPPSASESLTLMKTKERAEILRINEALRRHRNNRVRAAKELGISRPAFYKKLHKYGLYKTA